MDFYAKAVEQDPNFTRAFSGWALSLTYLGRTDEAEPLREKALANLDRVTERERLRTLGLYYSIVTRNYQKALESYQSLVDNFPADDIGYNNLAVLNFLTLNFDNALNPLILLKLIHKFMNRVEIGNNNINSKLQ